jgi:hypothetical protein
MDSAFLDLVDEVTEAARGSSKETDLEELGDIACDWLEIAARGAWLDRAAVADEVCVIGCWMAVRICFAGLRLYVMLAVELLFVG